MASRDPRFIWISSTPEQALSLLKALAGDDPPGFANEYGGTVRSLFSTRTREVLQYFGIFLPRAAIPDEVLTPSEEDARAILNDIGSTDAPHPSYVGFRPPYCGGTPPSYSLTFAYMFEAVAERAAESPDSGYQSSS